jgi:predicted dinucleotide-binding enzyme
MRIGLIGTGSIGKTLARKLAATGHDVKVANSRGPDSIGSDLLEFGARAVTVEEALADVEVAIISIPLKAMASIKHLISAMPEDAVVIDTSNYYPGRDGQIPAIDAGQTESEWVSEQLGRPIVKAWNAIGAHSFAINGKPQGHAERIAIPVAADRQEHRDIGIALVNDTGFDGYDAGTLADSWRQQPAAPAYTTDLTHAEMGRALASAERHRLPKRRDLMFAIVMERYGYNPPDVEWNKAITRALYM